MSKPSESKPTDAKPSADAKRPQTHYDLLKLPALEPDVAVVRKQFTKAVEQVRAKIAVEPNSPRWPELLKEMTKAMLVLCDARRKNDYDQTIGGKTGRDVRLVSIDKLIRGRKVLEPEALEKAQKLADTVNLDLHEAILNQKLAPPETIMPVYAESIGLPYVELSALTFDESLMPTVPAIMARQNTFVPVLIDDKEVIVAATKPLKPEIEDQLRLRFGAQVRQVICTKAAVDAAIAKYYTREAAMAEMHTAPQSSTVSSSSAEKSTSTASSSAPKRKSKEESRQNKLKIGAVCGMMTAMSIILGLNLFTEFGQVNVILTYLIGLGAGALAFGIGFLAAE
jgi:hypothetical protein